jgi:hypothetical protein
MNSSSFTRGRKLLLNHVNLWCWCDCVFFLSKLFRFIFVEDLFQVIFILYNQSCMRESYREVLSHNKLVLEITQPQQEGFICLTVEACKKGQAHKNSVLGLNVPIKFVGC